MTRPTEKSTQGGNGARTRRKAGRAFARQAQLIAETSPLNPAAQSCIHCIFCDKVLAPEYVARSLHLGNPPRKCYSCTSLSRKVWARGHPGLVRLLMTVCADAPVLNGSAP